MTIDEFLKTFEKAHRKLPMVVDDGYIRHEQGDSKYCPITAVARMKLTDTPIEVFRPRIFDAAYAAEWATLLGLESDDTEAIQLAADGDASFASTVDRKKIRRRMMAIVG